jgi:hypothetical protein
VYPTSLTPAGETPALPAGAGQRPAVQTAILPFFSQRRRILLFSLHSSIEVGGCALVAFEMPSAKLLWSAQHEAQSSGRPIFSPGSSNVLVPMQDGSILAYNVEDGVLAQRLPSGLNEPIQALAFDHDGRTLWLATEEALVQPPAGE